MIGTIMPAALNQTFFLGSSRQQARFCRYFALVQRFWALDTLSCAITQSTLVLLFIDNQFIDDQLQNI